MHTFLEDCIVISWEEDSENIFTISMLRGTCSSAFVKHVIKYINKNLMQTTASKSMKKKRIYAASKWLFSLCFEKYNKRKKNNPITRLQWKLRHEGNRKCHYKAVQNKFDFTTKMIVLTHFITLSIAALKICIRIYLGTVSFLFKEFENLLLSSPFYR